MSNFQEKFIIGLGNPGKKFKNNRHNIGFLLMQKFVERNNSKFVLKNKIKCEYSKFQLNETIYRIFMPTTFMNNSGEAIRLITEWYKIDKKKLIIIVDDLDLPLGKIRLRRKGGSGGHNGLKSIINQLNSEAFLRIRIGIGSPALNENEKRFNTISHVLGDFSIKEKIILEKVFNKIIESLENLNELNENLLICELNSFKDY
tara:strand:+ start:548 stop:1153 length:606 start_codon:yes stop_codon:yes gene_type:complete